MEFLLNDLIIVGGHLDLAENSILFGRDLTLNIAELRTIEKRTSRSAWMIKCVDRQPAWPVSPVGITSGSGPFWVPTG
jgi:hypothetical protein